MAFTQGFWAADTPGTVANLNACLLGWGPLADFPAAAAGNKGMIAYATDLYRWYSSDGASWVERSGGKYTELATPPSQAGGVAWADWDLSASIPVGAKAVVILAENSTNATATPGARKNGSASVFINTYCAAYSATTFVTELDALRIVEIIDATTRTLHYAIGYFS